MAGLLDAQDAALMALGTGLLGGGTFAQALGRGGQGFLSTYAAMQQAQEQKALKERELAMQEEIRRAQIANYESEIKAREQQQSLAQQKQAQIQGLLSEFNTPQAPINAASAALSGGGGPTMANAANLPQPNPADRMALIQRMAIAGVPGVSTMFDVEKWKADPLKLEPGSTYVDRVTKQERVIPKLPEGGQMIGGQFSFLPGYQDALAGLEGSKTRASESGKAAYDLVTVTGPDGKAMQMTRADAVARAGGGSPSQNIGGAITPELRALIEADAMREGVTSPKINLTDPGRGNTWGLAGAPKQAGMQVQSEAEKAAAIKTAEIKPQNVVMGNEDFMKRVYPSVQSAGDAAGGIIESANIAREALMGLGNTGWGTPAIAAAANVLTSLGVDVGNAKLYAANAERFQNVALTRLQEELVKQKGPQTEGDAKRQAETWAQLKTTTQANEYILDLMQARAERDRMKAEFYKRALPLAQQRGDLSEVDREWSTRSPSIFSMPTMQRWNKK